MAIIHKTPKKPNPRTGRPGPKTETIRRQVKVAVFEDCAMALIAYTDTFISSNASVVTPKAVVTADEALEIFRTEHPDVVITDLSLTMGGTEGFEILRRIKEISPSTPVGLSSSAYNPKGSDDINNEMRRKGFDALFQKFDLDGMCAFIARFSP